MADAEETRSRVARAAAERALVRVVHHYGERPEFVVLGGLIPQLLCTTAEVPHAGTTDIDVQVDLEIAGGAVNTSRLEEALKNAEFTPDDENIWRWRAEGENRALVKFELLADLDDEPANVTVRFDDCQSLGAANLRGTGVASDDVVVTKLSAKDGGVWRSVEVNTTGTAGFLLAKVAAAHGRRAPKDFYDIAYVLLHNDLGGHEAATQHVIEKLGHRLAGLRTAIVELAAAFEQPTHEGARAYAEQVILNAAGIEAGAAAADAVTVVSYFCEQLLAAIDRRPT
jgi:hypothetical protein